MPADRILVLGLMGRYPMAGVGWQALHYLIGLERLGFEVYYAEDSGAPPYDPRRVEIGSDAVANVAFVRDAMRRTDHPERWVYWDVLRDEHHGLGRDALDELYASSGQIWNLCGATRLAGARSGGGRRVYVQTDPGFEQVALASGDARVRAAIDAHDVLFTYGENLTRPGSALPSGGRLWHPTRPPILLDQWESRPPSAAAPFSTVGSWQNRGKDVRWQGARQRWSKHAAFLALVDAPGRAGVRVDAALAPPPEARARMLAHGWRLRDPHAVSGDLETYRSFVRASCAEFTVAKELYVRSASGWFSDRSASYLAAGRPVVTQDTGCASFLPTGRGLLAYRTMPEAVAALRSVRDHLPEHARAARAIAEEHFDARRVLGRMLEKIAASRTRPDAGGVRG